MAIQDFKLVALKPFTYGTRRLLPGDDFTVDTSNRFRRFQLLGQARKFDENLDKPKKAGKVQKPTEAEVELLELREEYEERFGEAPDGRWGADTIQDKLAES
jgi:hypothetical protein